MGLRHCVTSGKVAGSILDRVTGVFFIDLSFQVHYGPGVDLVSNTRDISCGEGGGGKGDRCVGLTTLPPSCADCLEILGALTSWNPKGLFRPVAGKLYLYFCKPGARKLGLRALEKFLCVFVWIVSCFMCLRNMNMKPVYFESDELSWNKIE
jgi:hypothetical protein